MTTPNQVAEVARLIRGGARRALLRMGGEPQFPGKATFDAGGAWALYVMRLPGRATLTDRVMLPDGKYRRAAYILTPLGLAVRAHLEASGHDRG